MCRYGRKARPRRCRLTICRISNSSSPSTGGVPRVPRMPSQIVPVRFPGRPATGMKAALLRRVILPTWQYVRRQNGFQLLRDLDKTQWLSPEDLQDLQWGRVGDLLEHAYAHVPYYSEAMRRLGADPFSLARERSLARLPLIGPSDCQ